MKKYRQLHLWIGLITSVLLLLESITGLLLAEPWLMGGSSPSLPNASRISETKPPGQALSGQNPNLEDSLQQNFTGQQRLRPGRGEGTENSLMRFVKGLHAGRVGSVNLRIFVDIAALAMIVLTVTGIILSVKILTAQRKARLRTITAA